MNSKIIERVEAIFKEYKRTHDLKDLIMPLIEYADVSVRYAWQFRRLKQAIISELEIFKKEKEAELKIKFKNDDDKIVRRYKYGKSKSKNSSCE